MKRQTILLILLIVASTNARKDVPTVLSYGGRFKNKSQEMKAAKDVSHWTPNEKNNPWELSGLFEGDIMKVDTPRNGIEFAHSRWPKGQVPYFIDKKFFKQDEINKILSAMNEFHQRSCVRFRPFTANDPTYIWIKGEKKGCWSYVGRISSSKHKGQEVNLQPPACLVHGTIVHELLHALGFYHQHSAASRDQYIRIIWPNIVPGTEDNFKKHPTKSYGVSYDYNSVMHYSSFASSRNGQPTIVPLVSSATIGQRKGLSDKDVQKLLNMYGCKRVKGGWTVNAG